MMEFTALHIPCADERQAEILTAELADFPFDSFEPEADRLTAYAPAAALAGCRTQIDALLARYGVAGRYETIAAQDWNAPWERDFQPVEVEGRLLIRAPFHAPAPAGVMEVIITPRLSFGTGHHITTRLMAGALLDSAPAGRRVLDMGSGTGVLAIVAAKCGAAHVDAVDIDEWADASCRENTAANGVAACIDPILGDVTSIAGRRYDLLLANINRNILLADMPAYAAALLPGGELLMSGFLAGDAEAVAACAARHGLSHVATIVRDGWALVRVKLDV